MMHSFTSFHSKGQKLQGTEVPLTEIFRKSKFYIWNFHSWEFKCTGAKNLSFGKGIRTAQ